MVAGPHPGRGEGRSQPAYGSQPQPSYGAPSASAYPTGNHPGYGAGPYGPQQGIAYIAGQPVRVAGMGARFLARLLDGFLNLLVLGLLFGIWFAGAASSGALGPGADEGTEALVGLGLFALLGGFFVLAVGYEVGMIATKGATLGKMAAGIRVVDENTGNPIGGGQSALRFVIHYGASLLCSLIALVVYLSPLFDNTGRNQGWHDKVANDLVVAAR